MAHKLRVELSAKMMMALLTFPVAIALFVTSASAQPQPTTQMPLYSGVKWVYRGKVEWTEGHKVKKGRVKLTTEVIATFGGKNRDVLVAVLTNYPGRLAWWSAEGTDHYDVLVSLRGKLYIPTEVQGTQDRSAAVALAQRIASGSLPMPDPADSELMLEFPLVVGARWGEGTNRDDGMYCWTVTGAKEKLNHVSGHRYTIYSLAYHTNPDDTLIEFAPTIGITRYVYRHHGTVSSADVELVAINFPRRRRAGTIENPAHAQPNKPAVGG